MLVTIDSVPLRAPGSRGVVVTRTVQVLKAGTAPLQEPVVLAIWTVLALVPVACLLLGLPHKILRRELKPVSFVPAAIALVVAAWLGSGIGGRPLRQIDAFLPPPITPAFSATTTGTTQPWILNDYDGAIQTARSAGKLVFIDFTGYTCTNCRWMEANIFSRPDVSAELGRFVLARLYTDGEGEMYERQQSFQERTFGTVALPLYAVVDAKGTIKATLSGLTRDPAEFIAFLRRADAPRVASATLR